CLASQNRAGILTYFKGFWRCPDGKDAAKTWSGIESEAPSLKPCGFHAAVAKRLFHRAAVREIKHSRAVCRPDNSLLPL
ncbi:MAG: hypothetical protein RR288_01600, partial [Oscillibacter sp.]